MMASCHICPYFIPHHPSFLLAYANEHGEFIFRTSFHGNSSVNEDAKDKTADTHMEPTPG